MVKAMAHHAAGQLFVSSWVGAELDGNAWAQLISM